MPNGKYGTVPHGFGYLGTDKIETSTANQELIPVKPTDWTVGYKIYKMSFLNKAATNIIINGVTNIYLEANQGFETNIHDQLIDSFVVVDDNIPFQFIAAY